ncbi:MAG: glycogen synthase GlgA [Acidobacteria bacterium]|nr:MAG: glycogen synthase GlgA [Acidobacteriota bacterium]
MPDGRPLDVVMFAAEAFPFVKVGGLGDIVGALPKYLKTLGAEPSIVIPAYKDVHHDRHGIAPYAPVPEFLVPMGPGWARAEIYHGALPGTDIDVFFIGCVDYFYRDGVYDDPGTGEGFPDNMERYVFFMKAGLELWKRLARNADVLHCHDSQAGLIPGMLKTTYADDPSFQRAGTLFTIHNLAYQGVYPKESLYWAGIDYRHFYPTSPFEFWGKVNFTKVGIECADLVSTVSETYAREIQESAEFGYGLEGVLRRRSEDLFGIVNGIDYREWNPETDPLLPAHFSSRDLAGKAVCKRELQAAFGLPPRDGQVPVFGIVSRLTDQKGLDLIAEAVEEITALDLQMIVLGNGQRHYHDLFGMLAERYPEKIGVRFGHDNRLAHLVEAGADIFLMPSKYEPCGLNQIYSLRYGAVPVVRATGGLVDTVQNYDLESETGSGFSFESYSAAAMMDALRRALRLYSDAERWRRLQARIMTLDWSWEASARKYMELRNPD